MSWAVAANPLDGVVGRGCWAPDLSEFVVTGTDNAATKVIARSSDGITWTYEPSIFDGGQGSAVVRVAALGLYIAVGGGGGATIATSPDGAAWTSRGNPGTNGFAACVACKPSTGLSIVGAGDGTENLLVTTDGITYTPVSSPFDGVPSQVTGIAYSPSADRWIAGGTDGSAAVAAYSDDDGATWTPLTHPMTSIQDVYRDEAAGKWWLLGQTSGGTVAVSDDNGATWTERTTPLDGGTAYGMIDVGGAVLGLAGQDAATTNQLCVSTNGGITWAYDATASVFGTSFGFGLGMVYSAPLNRALALGSTDATITFGLPSIGAASLIIRIYDLGTTLLADISSIALEKSLVRQLNGPRSFTVTAPAGHVFLTAAADDGYPNLHFGNRKLVVWENSDPDTEDPIFHGRIFTVERDGDANSVQAKITAYDPWMELGYDADNRAGRLVRDSSTSTFGDPSFLSPAFTPTPSQDGISGPDLIQQVLTYSQGDPTTNPLQGEGPLPIDIVSGDWDLDVPPALDVNPVDSADWPVLIGDFINQLIQSGAVDFDLRPIRPGTGLNLDSDPDDYIMVEASSKSKMGTDLSATVHFDFLTGDHNAAACKLVDDFSTVCQHLWYELGPRINQQHWRGDITPHSSGELGDASAAIYGGPDTPPGYFASVRVEDSLGTETSSRPLYTALYFDETGLRREPRRLLYITPADGDKALFQFPQDADVYDVIQIKTGLGFGVEVDEAQRVYGYTKTWTRENVSSVGQLLTSADYSVGGE